MRVLIAVKHHSLSLTGENNSSLMDALMLAKLGRKIEVGDPSR